jgi:hypothetical protein
MVLIVIIIIRVGAGLRFDFKIDDPFILLLPIALIFHVVTPLQ